MTKKTSSYKVQDDEQEVMKLTTTSARIRFLHGKGYDKADIHRLLGIRYQHVRNVLLQPLKRQ